jgi:hypothetical protein
MINSIIIPQKYTKCNSIMFIRERLCYNVCKMTKNIKLFSFLVLAFSFAGVMLFPSIGFAQTVNFYRPTGASAVACEASEGNFPLTPPVTFSSSGRGVSYSCVFIDGDAIEFAKYIADPGSCTNGAGGLNLGGYGFYCLPGSAGDTSGYKVSPVVTSSASGSNQATVSRQNCEQSGGTWTLQRDGSVTVGVCASCPSGTVSNRFSCVSNTSGSGSTGGSTDVSLSSDLEFGESGSKIFGYLQTAVNLLTVLAGLAITGSVIFAGIQYSAAGGNPQATSKAKNRIINSFVALLALVFLFAFFQWLVPGGIFG